MLMVAIGVLETVVQFTNWKMKLIPRKKRSKSHEKTSNYAHAKAFTIIFFFYGAKNPKFVLA